MAGISGEIANLVVQLRLDDSGFSNKLRGVQGSLGKFSGGMSQMGRGVGQVASGIDRLATRAAIAAAGGLTAVVTTAASFEQAFTGIEKTVDAGGKSVAENTRIFAQLEEQFRQMARTIPVSFEELAGIGEAGGALGIAKEDLLDFTDVVARLGVSTDLSSDQAATALGHLGTVLHLRGDDFRDFADSLVALGNAGASTESEIIDIANRFAAAGNAAGLTKEDILGMASAVASMGVPIEAAGTSLSRIFNSVATNIGTSSKKAVAFADTMGLTAKEFKRAWEEDALGTFQDFLRELGKLDQFEQANVLKKIGITGQRDLAAVGLMTQNLGFFNEQLEVSRKAQGELNKESQKFFDTTSGQWKIMVNNLRDAGVTIGNELLPTVKELVAEFTAFIGKASTQKGLKNFGKDLAEGVRGLVTELRGTDFSGIIGGMKLAAQVAKGAFDAFRALPEPIQQLAIAALVANKLSGGAVGQIAKGLGNIAFGGGKGLAGLFGQMRGQTPMSPMFVSVVGPGGLGGLGGGPKGGLPFGTNTFGGGGSMGGNLLKTAFKVAGVGMALGFLQEMTGQNAWWEEFPEKRFRPDLAPSKGGVTPVKVTNADEFDRSTLRGIQRSNQILAQMSLEQRLVKDKTFKPQLDAAGFIRLLKRTSEFGAKGVGTSIERGRRTGRDPVGDAFLALVGRLEKPALKSVTVQGEISRHITALEQVQGRLIRGGNIAAARHAQRNIDAMHRLIGTVDKTRPLLRENARQAQRVAAKVAEQRLATERGFIKANAALGIVSRKDFSPSFNANVYTTVNAQLSTYNALTTIDRVTSIRYGGKPVPLG